MDEKKPPRRVARLAAGYVIRPRASASLAWGFLVNLCRLTSGLHAARDGQRLVLRAQLGRLVLEGLHRRRLLRLRSAFLDLGVQHLGHLPELRQRGRQTIHVLGELLQQRGSLATPTLGRTGGIGLQEQATLAHQGMVGALREVRAIARIDGPRESHGFTHPHRGAAQRALEHVFGRLASGGLDVVAHFLQTDVDRHAEGLASGLVEFGQVHEEPAQGRSLFLDGVQEVRRDGAATRLHSSVSSGLVVHGLGLVLRLNQGVAHDVPFLRLYLAPWWPSGRCTSSKGNL